MGDTTKCEVPSEVQLFDEQYKTRHISHTDSVIWTDPPPESSESRQPLSAVCRKCGDRLKPNFEDSLWEAVVIFEEPY